MTRRDDKKTGSHKSQDALQDYLQKMLFDGTAEVTVPHADASASQPDTAALPSQVALPKAVEPKPQRKPAVKTANAHSSEQFAGSDELAKSADLEQKLLQARVKDLAEKSVQAVKDRHAQQLQRDQQLQQDADRRERMQAARELVKQRIAARTSADHLPAAVTDEIADSVPTPEVAPESPVQKPQPWLENGRPVWAQSAFECLLFSVGGLVLAVPLVELGSIYPVRDHLTPIAGQIDWFMGLLHVHGRNHVRTVNTAKIVMPEKYDAAFVDNIRYVISINGFDWGLAVNNVDKSITLVPEDVRWRTERSKRPWLAGTVVEYMCALVDVQELAVMLSSADNSPPRTRH
jgi:chemotaxis signal transduction protein